MSTSFHNMSTQSFKFRSITGHVFTIPYDKNLTVAEAKKKLHAENGKVVSSVIFNGNYLDDNVLLHTINAMNEYFIIRMDPTKNQGKNGRNKKGKQPSSPVPMQDPATYPTNSQNSASTTGLQPNINNTTLSLNNTYPQNTLPQTTIPENVYKEPLSFPQSEQNLQQTTTGNLSTSQEAFNLNPVVPNVMHSPVSTPPGLLNPQPETNLYQVNSPPLNIQAPQNVLPVSQPLNTLTQSGIQSPPTIVPQITQPSEFTQPVIYPQIIPQPQITQPISQPSGFTPPGVQLPTTIAPQIAPPSSSGFAPPGVQPPPTISPQIAPQIAPPPNIAPQITPPPNIAPQITPPPNIAPQITPPPNIAPQIAPPSPGGFTPPGVQPQISQPPGFNPPPGLQLPPTISSQISPPIGSMTTSNSFTPPNASPRIVPPTINSPPIPLPRQPVANTTVPQYQPISQSQIPPTGTYQPVVNQTNYNPQVNPQVTRENSNFPLPNGYHQYDHIVGDLRQMFPEKSEVGLYWVASTFKDINDMATYLSEHNKGDDDVEQLIQKHGNQTSTPQNQNDEKIRFVKYWLQSDPDQINKFIAVHPEFSPKLSIFMQKLGLNATTPPYQPPISNSNPIYQPETSPPQQPASTPPSAEPPKQTTYDNLPDYQKKIIEDFTENERKDVLRLVDEFDGYGFRDIVKLYEMCGKNAETSRFNLQNFT